MSAVALAPNVALSPSPNTLPACPQDACNAKSNHQHLGTIKSSNLCTEIMEYTSPDEVAVCNLASISLSMFVDEATRTFDHDHLARVVKVVTRNLNKVCMCVCLCFGSYCGDGCERMLAVLGASWREHMCRCCCGGCCCACGTVYVVFSYIAWCVPGVPSRPLPHHAGH